MTTLIHYEYARPGKGSMVFDQWLVHDGPDVKILLLDAHDGPAVRVGSSIVLDPGAPALWYVFRDAWYDVGRFHRGDGTCTGWYTNICTPVRMQGTTWSSTDLFLDYWTPMGGEGRWLDEQEFAEASRDGVLNPADAARTAEVRREIERHVGAGAWPPPIARDFTLGDAMIRRQPRS